MKAGQIPCWWAPAHMNELRAAYPRAKTDSPFFLLCSRWNEPCAKGKCERRKDVSKIAADRRGVGTHRAPPPMPFRAAVGKCGWCGEPTLDPDGQVSKRRSWHSGRDGERDCKHEHDVRTHRPSQLAYLLKRDGPGCQMCGEIRGAWGRGGLPQPEKLRSWGPSWARRYPKDVYVGELTWVSWCASLEVDHIVALGLLLADLTDAERWEFFGPDNIWGLCSDCHRIKTADDVRLIKAAGGPVRRPQRTWRVQVAEVEA